MSHPFQSFIMNLLDGESFPQGTTVRFHGDGMGGGGNAGIFPFGSATPLQAHSASNVPSAGSVYSGGVAPSVWIQREQQRPPFHGVVFPNAEEQNVSTAASTRLREDGNRAFKAGRYHDALRSYSMAIAADPTDEVNYTNRSFAHYKLSNYLESEHDAQEAVNINSNFFKGYYRLGLAQFAQGKYDEALENLKKAKKMNSNPNDNAIDVAISKCESKLARGSMSMSPASPASSADFSQRYRPAIGWTAGPPPDYKTLLAGIGRASDMRDRIASYQKQHDQQRDVVECRERSQRVQQLMAIATSRCVTDLSKKAQEKQDLLRQLLKSDSRSEYYEAKKSRDETYAKVWETASQVEQAIGKLRTIAAEEQSFFSRFGPPQSGSGADASAAAASGNSSPSLVEASPSARSDRSPSPKPLSGTAAEDADRLGALLKRRAEIEEEVRLAQQRCSRTDDIASALQEALAKEAADCAKLPGLLEEADRLNEDLEAYARQVAQTTTKELSRSRLDALDQVSSYIERVKADEASFIETQNEGDRLLSEEASLERERLLYERQRIQLQAEVEWFKVRDEPPSKIEVLQAHLKKAQELVADTDSKQKAVQKRILELVEGNHPELAWKSMASGSRILRLAKGSGLWMNLSLSDFQIVSTLSSTVNSKVYHAVRRGEHVALKEISVDDESARRRFQREINIVATCNHPNIIRIKGVFFDGPFAYVLLPYYSNGSLKTFINKGEAVPWVAMQDMFRQIASGVAYLHERGIVHGDLKPSNILLADDGRPLISDFGIAKEHGQLGEAAMDLTVTMTNSGSSAAGTTSYMAPEQLLGERHAASGKSDIWALGVTYYEVATANAKLLDGSLEDPASPGTMTAISNNNGALNISSKQVGGDERLSDMIASALTVDVSRRATAYELLGHPYFSSSLSSVHSTDRANLLAKSDERIEAVRGFIHALRTAKPQKVLVSVSRNQMVASLASIFDSLPEEDIISPIMVVFQGEAGIDEGALTTEMLRLYYEQVITEKKALVCASEMGATAAAASNGLMWSVSYLPAEDEANVPASTFDLLGKVLLKSMIEGRQIPLQLSSAVLKYFGDVPVSMADLEEYDSVLADTLKRMRLLSASDLEDADLNFSHFSTSFLAQQHNGRYIRETAVTTDNVRDYVNLRVQYDLIEKRKKALESMKKGFYTSCSLIEPHLKLLSPSDLHLLLCGAQHVSAQTIVDALDFQNFDRASNTPEYLKDIIMNMSQNNLRRFLQFCTSTAALPADNSMKKIKVLRTGDLDRLPVGHGCVNQLDLPDYNNKQMLQEKLELALAHASDGFHIV